jgi:hypothetical protein
MKRRPKEFHLEARKGGRSAGEADRRRGQGSGGGAIEEWRSFGERCGLERELGAYYIGSGEEWRGRG